MIAKTFDVYLAYKFIKLLTTPFEKTDAYELGVIDKNGNVLLGKRERNSKQNRAFTTLHKIAFNIKKLLMKVPGGSSKIATYSAALFLIKEELENMDVESDIFIEALTEHFNDIEEGLLNEEIANTASGGGVHLSQPAPLGKSDDYVGGFPVFDVSDSTFRKLKGGKKRHTVWDKYIQDKTEEVSLKQYVAKHPSQNVVVRHNLSKEMFFFKKTGKLSTYRK